MKGAVCRVALVLSQEQSRQGDVLELAQVAEIVLDGQALLTCPGEGLTQSPLRDPHPCPEGRYGTHIWVIVTHIMALCLPQQVESAVQISLGLPYPGHS